MLLRLIIYLATLLAVIGCTTHSREDYFLDPAIPRIETDTSKIAYIRTTWMNDRHVGTAFLDSQNRVLEVFKFGRNNFKTVQRYEGTNNIVTIGYSHSDSDPIGLAHVGTTRRKYDSMGRLRIELRIGKIIDRNNAHNQGKSYYKRFLDYTTQGDTIVTKVESSDKDTGANWPTITDEWEWDRQKHLRQHYQLYIGWWRHDTPRDTLYHFSQRYAYDSLGRLALSWFEPIYRARYRSGSDTKAMWYRYDDQNRLVEERYYTSDMGHVFRKARPDLNAPDRKKEDWYRKNYFVPDSALRNNKDYFSIKYQYEAFDPKKHLPLKIPIND